MSPASPPLQASHALAFIMVVPCLFRARAPFPSDRHSSYSNAALGKFTDRETLPCSNRHGVNLAAPQEMRRLIMHVVSADFAMEWVRPMPPNVKLVGPVLPEPPKALPADTEVRHTKSLEALAVTASKVQAQEYTGYILIVALVP